MKIKKIESMHRRDFTALYECEFCGATKEGRGYDDSNFHNNVIPKMTCEVCGKHSDGITSSATNPDWMQY
jgi:primosomal protein N'